MGRATHPNRLLTIMRAEYVEQGYMHSAGLTLQYAARATGLSVTQVLDAFSSLTARGLAERFDCLAFVIGLTPTERLKLIRRHRLAERWEQRAPAGFYPNHPLYGEVPRVYRETGLPATR